MKYSPEMTREIASMLEDGSNRTDACTIAGIHYETFTEWMQKPDFAEAIKKAEANFKNSNIKIIKKAAQNTWQAAAWLLERKYHLEYAVKKDGQDDESIPQKMADRAAELLKKLETTRGIKPRPVHS